MGSNTHRRVPGLFAGAPLTYFLIAIGRPSELAPNSIFPLRPLHLAGRVSRLVDVVLVTKLDRLGRSTRELLDLIERIGKAGASFRSLGDPLWDTSSSQGRLLSTLLAAIAEFERDLIRQRTGDGRRRAQANGVKFGRKPKLSDFQRKEAIKRRAAGERLASIAKSYAVDVSMISRLAE